MDKATQKTVAGCLTSYKLARDLEIVHPALDVIEKMVAALPPTERRLIEARYFSPDGPYTKDFQVYQSFGIAPRTYSRQRENAFNKLLPIVKLISSEQHYGFTPEGRCAAPVTFNPGE